MLTFVVTNVTRLPATNITNTINLAALPNPVKDVSLAAGAEQAAHAPNAALAPFTQYFRKSVGERRFRITNAECNKAMYYRCLSESVHSQFVNLAVVFVYRTCRRRGP